jgi:hypothetical protein
MPATKSGPYLLSALICQQIVHEPDGQLSVIRITDGQIITNKSADAPVKMPKVEVKLNVLVTFVGDKVSGTHAVSLVPHMPSGKRLPASKSNLDFQGGHSKTYAQFVVGFPTQEEGLYWFDIYFDDELETRVPYTLAYTTLSS